MKTIHWLIPISLAILLSSCDSCRPRIEGKSQSTEAQKKLIPYKKKGLVKFTNKSGQIVDFKVTKNKTDLRLDAILEGGMCEDYWGEEFTRIILSSMSDDFEINLRRNVYRSHKDKSNPKIWRGSCNINIYGFLDNNTYLFKFVLSANEEGAFATDTTNTVMHESLEINNHIYHDVIEQKRTIERANGKKIPTQLFYNKNYGILQIKVDNENFLMLNR